MRPEKETTEVQHDQRDLAEVEVLPERNEEREDDRGKPDDERDPRRGAGPVARLVPYPLQNHQRANQRGDIHGEPDELRQPPGEPRQREDHGGDGEGVRAEPLGQLDRIGVVPMRQSPGGCEVDGQIVTRRPD